MLSAGGTTAIAARARDGAKAVDRIYGFFSGICDPLRNQRIREGKGERIWDAKVGSTAAAGSASKFSGEGWGSRKLPQLSKEGEPRWQKKNWASLRVADTAS